MVDNTQALTLIKARLNRLSTDTTLDNYLEARIDAARSELAGTGIVIDDFNMADIMLLVDIVVWQYRNRDAPGGMPDWLRLRRRERFLRQGGEITIDT